MDVDYLIIGAGPAGLQLAYFLERAGHSYVVLERGTNPGTFFESEPRHRILISSNRVHTGSQDPERNLRWDWNSLLSDDLEMRFTRWTSAYLPHAERLLDYLAKFAERFSLQIRYRTEIPPAGISKAADRWHVTDTEGQHYSSGVLVVATGLAQPYLPPIPGIELAQHYHTVSIDPADYLDQRVLIIGKGNAAFETADPLVETTSLLHLASPRSVTMAYKTKYVGNVRSHLIARVVDSYQLKLGNVLIDAKILGLRRSDAGTIIATFHYSHADDEIEDIAYDRVIACTGFRFDASLFDKSCHPELTIQDRFPAMTSAWESVNQPGLYFAGTLMQQRDYHYKQSGFIHGFRYNIQAQARIFEMRYHGGTWPSVPLQASPEELSAAVLTRMNRCSGPWQQTDFIGDVILLTSHDQALYYEDLPVEFLPDSFLAMQDYFVVTLNFGVERILASRDALAVERIHKDDVARAAESTGIHPIIRHYRAGQLVSTHHVIEDIDSEWQEAVHIQPLQAYFERELAAFRVPQAV